MFSIVTYATDHLSHVSQSHVQEVWSVSTFIGQKLMIPGIFTVFETKFISVIGISPFDFFWQKNRLQPARGEPCLKSLV